jgi:hypothetical protein
VMRSRPASLRPFRDMNTRLHGARLDMSPAQAEQGTRRETVADGGGENARSVGTDARSQRRWLVHEKLRQPRIAIVHKELISVAELQRHRDVLSHVPSWGA